MQLENHLCFILVYESLTIEYQFKKLLTIIYSSDFSGIAMYPFLLVAINQISLIVVNIYKPYNKYVLVKNVLKNRMTTVIRFLTTGR